ncbi:uncharacterized protein EDB91DRAFT_1350471 [Suillus paluster]|uniref:uncharacterized protein n=1 Tax=Suillus paluster TaxID=48578 RepID=UPI001B87D484|nr:uncharacterized protein EDB91DRAFT_1350471 [Suillus paluster]KAG1726715.1 hypothetical protein EDB91DRAFT_1350471 [Suillus paluster]
MTLSRPGDAQVCVYGKSSLLLRHHYMSTKFASSYPSSNSMTVVSNNPIWLPAMNSGLIYSYFTVAGSAGVIYDCMLTFGQEVELVWRQRWSLMTVLYLSVRYVGILYAVTDMLAAARTIPMTDAVRVSDLTRSFAQYNDSHSCRIRFLAIEWTNIVVFAMTGGEPCSCNPSVILAHWYIMQVIMITRLHAMYQRSRKVLILLIVVLLAVNIANGVTNGIKTRHASGKVYILFGAYECAIDYGGNDQLLSPLTWILTTVWEVLTLGLAVWIAVKHFRELRRSSTGGIIGDCFTVLMKTHVVYFTSFVAGSCFQFGYSFSTISVDAYPYSLERQIFGGITQIFFLVQMFVLGPHLILSVREYNAKLVDDSDAATAMTSIAFQDRVHVSTSSSGGRICFFVQVLSLYLLLFIRPSGAEKSGTHYGKNGGERRQSWWLTDGTSDIENTPGGTPLSRDASLTPGLQLPSDSHFNSFNNHDADPSAFDHDAFIALINDLNFNISILDNPPLNLTRPSINTSNNSSAYPEIFLPPVPPATPPLSTIPITPALIPKSLYLRSLLQLPSLSMLTLVLISKSFSLRAHPDVFLPPVPPATPLVGGSETQDEALTLPVDAGTQPLVESVHNNSPHLPQLINLSHSRRGAAECKNLSMQESMTTTPAGQQNALNIHNR